MLQVQESGGLKFKTQTTRNVTSVINRSRKSPNKAIIDMFLRILYSKVFRTSFVDQNTSCVVK